MIGALQENLLVLLAYDAERALTIRNTVEVDLFGGQYRELAVRLYDYLDKYKKPPRDHLPDILMDKISGNKNKREANLYKDVISSINELHTTINAEYVFDQLDKFIKRQSLRSVAIELSKELQRDTEESLEKAEEILSKVSFDTMKLFDPGTRLSDRKKALRFLDNETQAWSTGIKEFDRRGFGPTRKEMGLYIADTKTGKTWWLIQLAKMAMLHRLKVLHVSLEMSEERVAQRYFQAMFSMAKRKERLHTTRFELDNLGRIVGFDDKTVMPRLAMDDPNIRKKLESRIKKWEKRGLDNIIIKQFPMGNLTFRQLEAFINNLENAERFVPDLLILDYPDLMRLDPGNLRLEIDNLYKVLRGHAVERNRAIEIVSQSNRKGSESKTVGTTNVAEAYLKIAHCDRIIAYSQTEQEAKLGLARLGVTARNDQDKINVVLSQQYGIGQYAIDSTLMVGQYWSNIPRDGFEGDEDAESEDDNP